MLKNIKMGFKKEIYFKKCVTLALRNFNERNGRLFFINEYIHTSNGQKYKNSHTAMELIIENNKLNSTGIVYTAHPVYIYNDEMDNIVDVVPLHEAFTDSKVYFTYWKDLFVNFVGEIEKYVEYEKNSFIDFIKCIIEGHPNQCHYYADGNNNKFYFEILDQFQFVGNITSGMYDGNIIVSNIKLIDRYTEKTITELPFVQANGILYSEENENIEDLFCAYLHSMDANEMKGYILQSIENF